MMSFKGGIIFVLTTLSTLSIAAEQCGPKTTFTTGHQFIVNNAPGIAEVFSWDKCEEYFKTPYPLVLRKKELEMSTEKLCDCAIKQPGQDLFSTSDIDKLKEIYRQDQVADAELDALSMEIADARFKLNEFNSSLGTEQFDEDLQLFISDPKTNEKVSSCAIYPKEMPKTCLKKLTKMNFHTRLASRYSPVALNSSMASYAKYQAGNMSPMMVSAGYGFGINESDMDQMHNMGMLLSKKAMALRNANNNYKREKLLDALKQFLIFNENLKGKKISDQNMKRKYMEILSQISESSFLISGIEYTPGMDRNREEFNYFLDNFISEFNKSDSKEDVDKRIKNSLGSLIKNEYEKNLDKCIESHKQVIALCEIEKVDVPSRISKFLNASAHGKVDKAAKILIDHPELGSRKVHAIACYMQSKENQEKYKEYFTSHAKKDLGVSKNKKKVTKPKAVKLSKVPEDILKLTEDEKKEIDKKRSEVAKKERAEKYRKTSKEAKDVDLSSIRSKKLKEYHKKLNEGKYKEARSLMGEKKEPQQRLERIKTETLSRRVYGSFKSDDEVEGKNYGLDQSFDDDPYEVIEAYKAKKRALEKESPEVAQKASEMVSEVEEQIQEMNEVKRQIAQVETEFENDVLKDNNNTQELSERVSRSPAGVVEDKRLEDLREKYAKLRDSVASKNEEINKLLNENLPKIVDQDESSEKSDQGSFKSSISSGKESAERKSAYVSGTKALDNSNKAKSVSVFENKKYKSASEREKLLELEEGKAAQLYLGNLSSLDPSDKSFNEQAKATFENSQQYSVSSNSNIYYDQFSKTTMIIVKEKDGSYKLEPLPEGLTHKVGIRYFEHELDKSSRDRFRRVPASFLKQDPAKRYIDVEEILIEQNFDHYYSGP